MGTKSTVTINRYAARHLISDCLLTLSNKTLGNILDMIADASESANLKHENNFTVVDEENHTPTLCSVCGSLQFKTSSGITCHNGHGGAPAKGE